jgi:hypothetical protein
MNCIRQSALVQFAADIIGEHRRWSQRPEGCRACGPAELLP